ncbi:hypothetical protein ACSBR2_021074 [Camellia fascicularis]
MYETHARGQCAIKLFRVTHFFTTPPLKFTALDCAGKPKNSPEISFINRSSKKMESPMCYESDHLNLEATELRLGLPGTDEPQKQSSQIVRSNKRGSSEIDDTENGDRDRAPPSKAQVVGWPPVRSYRKNCFQAKKTEADGCGMYVKVSMDGAPYLRKIDLKVYQTYPELLKALEFMFKCTIGNN